MGQIVRGVMEHGASADWNDKICSTNTQQQQLLPTHNINGKLQHKNVQLITRVSR